MLILARRRATDLFPSLSPKCGDEEGFFIAYTDVPKIHIHTEKSCDGIAHFLNEGWSIQQFN